MVCVNGGGDGCKSLLMYGDIYTDILYVIGV